MIEARTRSRKYRIVTTIEKNLTNRGMLFGLRHGLTPKAYALIETTGRRTGLPRQTPVGNGLSGDTFWLISAHGMQADYVRNIATNPRVRVRVGKQWRSGAAVLMPEDDALSRSRAMPHARDAKLNRLLSTHPLTIRIDLDPVGTGPGGDGEARP